MMFMLLAVALSVIVVLLLLLPLFSKKHSEQEVQRHEVNVESAKTRMSELKEELANNEISEQEFERYRLEIEMAAAEDLNNLNANEQTQSGGNAVVAVLVALIVPLLSIVVYQQIGSEQALLQPELQQSQRTQAEELQKMLAAVEQEILNNPDDVEGRIALGQVYAELERYADAAMVYEQLNQLRPNDADILVNYAEALARSHGNRLPGKPLELLNQALAINPLHGRGLWLAGFAEMQSENKQQALAHWQRLLAGMEAGSEAYKQVEDLIQDVESGQLSDDVEVAANSQASETSLKVSVALAEDIKKKIDPNTTLFIFARAAQGPPMPLAVHRGLAKDLPLTVTLDDSMAMMPNMSLSNFPNVIVGARLSSNGQPQGQAGDLEGFSDIVEIASSDLVNVLIDSVKP